MLVISSATPLTARPDQDRAQTAEPHQLQAEAVQQVVDSLRGRIGIPAEVTVAMVDHDARRVSVRRESRNGAFALSVERGFAAGLTAAQLEAALAHELGHVWIYTHHPYLQTEQLANRIAMRVVPRRDLMAVYGVLWGADAVHGSLEAFLGLEPTTVQD